MKETLKSVKWFSTTIATTVAITLASGCAGISITPVPSQNPDVALDPNLAGYIVYEPMVVFPVMQAEACDKDQKCLKFKGCTIGQPLTLPNYGRPYVIEIRSGFGKAGADVTIADGWKLSNLKDNSDNTELLKLVASATGIAEAADTKECPTGLYRLIWSEGGPSLKAIDLPGLR